MGGKWEGINKFFFRERRKKEGINWEKCQKFAKNGPKIGTNSKCCIILHFSCFFLSFYLLFLVWEGNGKEILCTVGMGREWEGNGREMLL